MASSQKQEQVVNGLVTKSPGEPYSVLDVHNAGHCSSSYLRGLLILSSLGWLNHQPAYGRRTQDYRTWTESPHLFVCHCKNHNILLPSKIGQRNQIHLKITCLFFPLNFLCQKAPPESHDHHQQTTLHHLVFFRLSAKIFQSPPAKRALKPKQRSVQLEIIPTN